MAATPKKKPARKTPGNPPDSPWYSTRAADRVRKPITLTISDAKREWLADAAKREGRPMSAIIEDALDLYASKKP